MSDDTTTTDDRSIDNRTQLQRADDFIEYVRDHPAVVINDYDVSGGPYDFAEIDVSVTLREDTITADDTDGSSDSVVELVRAKVASLEEFTDDGAHLGDVLDPDVYDADVTADELQTAVNDLRTRGEIYEPITDRLRVV